jgi:uncharacterized protein (UPF0261 family)
VKEKLDPQIQIQEADHHINDPAFAAIAAQMIDQMIQEQT